MFAFDGGEIIIAIICFNEWGWVNEIENLLSSAAFPKDSFEQLNHNQLVTRRKCNILTTEL